MSKVKDYYMEYIEEEFETPAQTLTDLANPFYSYSETDNYNEWEDYSRQEGSHGV